MASGAAAQENEGLDQFSSFQPAPGEIKRVDMTEGVYSAIFNFREKMEVNRSADKFITLSYEETPIAVIPACNTKMLSFDSAMDHVWQIYFYSNGNPEQPAGNYSITFDEGIFLLGDSKTPSKKIVANYVLTPMAYTLDPAPGRREEGFDEMTITFPFAKEVKYNAGSVVEIFDLFSKGEETLSYKFDVTTKGNVATLYLDKPFSIPTTWKLAAPAGAFTLITEDGTESQSPVLNENYVILNWLNGKPTPNPAPGDITEFPGVITLTIPEGAKVQTVNDKVSVYIYPLNEDGSYGESIARYVASKNKNTEVPDYDRQILLTNLKGADYAVKPAPGKYVLSIGERLYRIDSDTKYCNSMTFEYRVLTADYDYTVTPGNEGMLPSLQEFTMTFPEAEKVEVVASSPCWLSSVLCSYPFYVSSVDDKTVRFRCEAPATYPGHYSISTLDNLRIDGKNVSFSIDFTLGGETGVEKVADELPALFTVYSIDGRIVKTNAKASDLQTLLPGLYIAGGKKILVK